MEFDRKGPEGGLEIYSSITSGKAFLEFKIHLQKIPTEEILEQTEGVSLAKSKDAHLDIRIWDREEHLVFFCRYPLGQEELAKGMILHPHLWQGTENPYLYRIRVSLMEREDYTADVLESVFALRTVREIAGKGWFLNDQPFQIRPVTYMIPTSASLFCMLNENARKECIRQDLELMLKMGANTVCPIGGNMDREFFRMCDEAGLLLWWCDKEKKKGSTAKGEGLVKKAGIPRFYGTENSLLTLHSRSFTDSYYFYKACWSKEPFVYISAKSLTVQQNGNVQVMVYSNQKKVALYVEGTLFEFRTEGPDFLFQEIPVKRLPLVLTAEAGECSMSLTMYPFT